MSRLLFAVVDAVLYALKKEGWTLRAWPWRREQFEKAREMLGWWRSTWISPG